MTNLEKMKNDICDQIQKMDATAFRKLVESVEDDAWTSSDNLFVCEKCELLYGECEDADRDICLKRFIDYCEAETHDAAE